MTNDLAGSAVSLGAGAAAVTVFMFVGWGLSVWRHKLVIVDTFWGLGFVVIAWTAFLTAVDHSGPGTWVLPLVVTVWGLRLAGYLLLRGRGQGEDPRYADLAERSRGSFAQVAARRVFLPQGLSMWLVGTPIMVGANNTGLVPWLLWLGLAVWGVGFFFESVGDFQLARFKAEPENKGQVMDRGLWRYTRHPNYFGDVCVWWGIWLIAASSWAGLATVFAPIAMTVFITRVTGLTLNEKGMHDSKPGYADYVRRTSPFFPMPPRKPSSE